MFKGIVNNALVNAGNMAELELSGRWPWEGGATSATRRQPSDVTATHLALLFISA